MKKKKAKRKTYPTKLKVVNIKMTHQQYEKFQKFAEKRFNGNLSEMLRSLADDHIEFILEMQNRNLGLDK